jgi:LL-diaminopimelate aminotransferase
MDIKPADRIASFKPYFFASLTQRLASLKSQGVDIIRLDMGSPDLPPADFITDTLINEARRSDTHGYPPIGGTSAYRRAIVTYYENRFEVELDPDHEVIGLIGSKEGLFNLSQVLLNPGDLALVPDPAYPVYKASGTIAGAEIYEIPLVLENDFLPDLEAIPEEIKRKAKLIWLNYPNNPTGAVAPMSFLEKAVSFAQHYGWIIAHDAPYSDVCFGDYHAPSILQIPGAKQLAVEFNSLSKAYNMAGWRLGMAVGNPQVISYLNIYKSQMDSSQFGPLMSAGVKALSGDQTWIQARNAIYQERRDIVVRCLREGGFKVNVPPAAIYVWAQLPEGEKSSTDFCMTLLEDTGVSTTPGVVYGNYGERYLRISLGTETTRITEAMQRLVTWAEARKKKV